MACWRAWFLAMVKANRGGVDTGLSPSAGCGGTFFQMAQTAPAAAGITAALVLGEAVPAEYAAIDTEPYLPARFG